MRRPINDSEDLKWVETHLAMEEGEEERGGKRGVWEGEEAANGREERCGDREAIADAIRESVPAIEVPLSNLSFQEDEMLSWLQYPLEDTFDRSYCSELFGEPFQNPQGFTDSTFRGLASQAVGSPECTGNIHKKADAAMALGAGRAAGLVPQTGSEAFHKVRTTVQQQRQPRVIAHRAIAPQPSPLPSASPSMPPQILRSSSLNFSHFTHPALAPKSNLPFVASSSDPTNLRSARQPFVATGRRDTSASPSPTNAEKTRPPSFVHGKEGFVACEPPIAESTATVMAGVGSCAQSSLSLQARETRQDTSSAMQGWCSRTVPGRHELDMGKEKVELGSQLVTSLSGSAITTSDKCMGTLETLDVDMASPSQGSDNSTEKSTKEAVAASSKRKTRPAEDSEYQSEDVEEVVANGKRIASGRPSATKRSRAAEIHNLSERKRRDKINVRMKALQELIPNANKTDKASMLDEAIEYMKMLQAQLQFMSMRTGMVVPPMMIPPGMQYLPMQQMPSFPHMGVGMGMGMGLGMGMGMGIMDASAAGASAGSAVVPLPLPGQALPIHAYHAAGFQPSTLSAVIPKARGQGAHVEEACNAFPAQQQSQPSHLSMQMNVDMYNAFMQQQQQKQESPSSKAIH